jgi:CcmD family protein
VNWYLFAGYAVFWVLVFVYLLYLHRRQSELARAVRELQEALREDGARGGGR